MKRMLFLLTMIASLPVIAAPCGAGLNGKVTVLEGAHYQLAFSASPSPIPAGQFFELDIALCPKAVGKKVGQLSIDAIMPKHQHGMNYQAGISARPNQQLHAEGLLFHMPGLWALHFDVAASADLPRERLTYQQEIK